MLQECRQKIERTKSLAKEEAAKYRAAKEVIKVLKSKVSICFSIDLVSC